jgi:hypothetical protein
LQPGLVKGLVVGIHDEKASPKSSPNELLKKLEVAESIEHSFRYPSVARALQFNGQVPTTICCGYHQINLPLNQPPRALKERLGRPLEIDKHSQGEFRPQPVT